MLVCLECGHIFHEDDIVVWQEDRGECFGYPSYERFSGCPHCHGNYVKVFPCACCGEYITDDYIKLANGDRICDNCYMHIKLGAEE